MYPKSLPSALILSMSSDGKTLIQNLDGNPITFEKTDNVLFVPIVLVDNRLATRDYALYLFDDDKDIKSRIEEVRSHEQDAIILVGTGKERLAYFIENGECSLKPVFMSYGLRIDKLSQLKANSKGKVEIEKNAPELLVAVIRNLRLYASRGNEVEITGTRTGQNVFSTSFGPCNPLVARRKKDNQFVLHHADGSFVDRDGGIGEFISSIENGGGAHFVAVMQNPKIARSMSKAPLLAGGLAVILQEREVMRVDFPEGYNAIACINGNTVILTSRMSFFHNLVEKKELIDRLQSQKIGEIPRAIDIRDNSQIIPMTKTVKEINDINQHLKKTKKIKDAPYTVIVEDLKELGIKIDPPKKEGFLSKIFKS